eukprot:TRINITY_DN28631_c0_g1_i1.p1 TRINITY_DN28631_c0_g1~~TRINITY_DN28631_c0_g1_i1.p1  ORF type:complete len:107 (+),score=17.81 TRINITY_DN28631_c0_g1_i1:50-322(+)
MTKSTLLNSIGLLTTICLQITVIAMSSQHYVDDMFCRAIASFDGAMNVVCMGLVFAFAAPYYKVVCRICDIGMSKCCICITEKAVLRTQA